MLTTSNMASHPPCKLLVDITSVLHTRWASNLSNWKSLHSVGQKLCTLIINREVREIMHLIASACPSVRLCVYLSVYGVKGGHYRSEGFVCLSVISNVMGFLLPK